MGHMRFAVPRPERLVSGAVEQAYLAGSDGVPWECRAWLEQDTLVVERDTRESGYLYVPWHVPGRGRLQLCSGSLMERGRTYCLPVELARGTVHRVRQQLAQWQAGGLKIAADFTERLKAASATLARAVTSQEHPLLAQTLSEDAIRQALDLGDQLCAAYVQQVQAARREAGASGGILWGSRLQTPLEGMRAESFQDLCNLAVVGQTWADWEPRLGEYDFKRTDALVAWCQQHQMRCCLGPLLRMDKHRLPDWLFLDDSYEEVAPCALALVEAVVQRYRGKVHLWHVAARMNHEGPLGFSEEHRLRLVVEAVDRVRSLDARTPVVVSFQQPWGEYIARQDQELTPLYFADTLLRGELGLSGIGIEIDYGYWPGGTLPRDPLEVSRLLDRWEQLGAPLMVLVAAPSSTAPDPLASHPARPLPDLQEGGVSPAWQQKLASWLLPLLLAKPGVQAIVWDPWQDDQPHELAHGGLWDAAGQPKPALQTWAELRRRWTL